MALLLQIKDNVIQHTPAITAGKHEIFNLLQR